MNLDCDNHVIFYYPAGSGGKFLINCLALSGQAVFQHDTLSLKDLEGKLSIKDKFDILLDYLNTVPSGSAFWTDFGFGDYQMFGIDKPRYSKQTIGNPDIVNPAVTHLTVSEDKLFFSACHNIAELETIKQIFKKSKIVQLTNPDKFLSKRNWPREKFVDDRAIESWNNIAEKSWHYPETLEEFESSTFHDKIKDNFPSTYFDIVKSFKLKQELTDIVGNYVWDCDDFLVESKFLTSIQNLYNYFSLGEIDDRYIVNFYRAWYSKITD